MLYYLFRLLEQFNIPGSHMWSYISFRSLLALILSLLISAWFGEYFIKWMKRRKIFETERDPAIDPFGVEKKGVPTMGGVIIIVSILVPILLFGRLRNIYLILMIVTTIWLGFLGFLDDYIKIFRKNKAGLAGKYKILGQIVLGIIVGSILFFHPDVTIREKKSSLPTKITTEYIFGTENAENQTQNIYSSQAVKSTKTTVPFFKDHELDYGNLLSFLGTGHEKWSFIVYIFIIVFIITAVSNGCNLTDGLDGLAAGTCGIIGTTLGILAYVSGNVIFANYLDIMYIPLTGELTIFISAFVGACLGFLWYNTHPASIFMGDTGSLALGGIIAVFAIIIRKELLIPILCGIFLVQSVSVIIQVSWFKYTKKKYGEGRRVFLMTPLHHHFQKKGIHEAKIVQRFLIVGILLAVLTIVTLKIR